jgi:signal transduction histidine kinase
VYCVSDNGIGMAPEHCEKAFEIFHRLNPGSGEGEGLGLTIVRRSLDKQGGRVWVESELGKGSRFFVSLPGA